MSARPGLPADDFRGNLAGLRVRQGWAGRRQCWYPEIAFPEVFAFQVRADNARERAIVREGVTVLRFSGSGVTRNCQACVSEIVEFMRSRTREQ